jgi:hypothetical protein
MVNIGTEGARWETYSCTLEEYFKEVAPPNSSYYSMVWRAMGEEDAKEIEEEVRRRLANPARQIPAGKPASATVMKKQPQKHWWEFWK